MPTPETQSGDAILLQDGGSLPAVWLTPPHPRAVVALAHGAGAGMQHPFMCAIHQGLAAGGFVSVKFQFPYMAAGRKVPDRAPVLESAWHAVLRALRERHPDLLLVAAGKSMGGRMASRVAAEGADVDALLMLGYPLHPAGRPQQVRADHFPRIRLPSLFVQGTRDSLCELALLPPALATLGGPTTLHLVEGGDHSFKVLKRAGRDQSEVDSEVLQTCVDWIGEQVCARVE